MSSFKKSFDCRTISDFWYTVFLSASELRCYTPFPSSRITSGLAQFSYGSASPPARWWEHESTEGPMLDINNPLVVISLFLIFIAREICQKISKMEISDVHFAFLSIKPRGIMGQGEVLMANVTTNSDLIQHISQLCLIVGPKFDRSSDLFIPVPSLF